VFTDQTIAFLDENWSAVLGCSPAQLRDGARHVVANPESPGVKQPWPLRADSVCMWSGGKGWVLSVPGHLTGRARELCRSRSFTELCAEGDGQYQEWFDRGMPEEQRNTVRGPSAYVTFARLAEGLPVRTWSHYLHWYYEPSSPPERPVDEHVRRVQADDGEVWQQWQAWPGPVCCPDFDRPGGLTAVFGYVLDRKLVSVAQIQAGKDDFGCELAVETLDDFVGRGFATEATRALTQHVVDLGRLPWYYHDHYNVPSSKVLRKLRYSLYAETLVSHMEK